MDKYEYRVRAEQIKSLLANKEYVEAMHVADTVDWRRVKSISMLCTVSEIYKINRKYEESRDILLLAYERYPTGRMIVYALCELSIKMGDVVQAVEYYKEFLQIAPKDTGKYVLQYKLYEAQEVGIEERIAVLEEFKQKEYREKWAYELAYLYHRIGLATRCVEECDELILWFGEGKYVQKAMELKMLHAPLNKSQQEKYEQENELQQGEEFFNETEEDDPAEGQAIPIQIKAVEPSHQPTVEIPSKEIEQEIQIQPVNMGKYSTINLQAELSKSVQELFDETDNQGFYLQEAEEEEPSGAEASEAETAETELSKPGALAAEMEETGLLETEETESADIEVPGTEESVFEEDILMEEEGQTDSTKEPDRELERILAQEYDGQISLVVPEPEVIEKQITGQMDISDVLAEWERMKQQNDRRRIEEAKKRSLEQTNDIMSQLVGVIPGIEKNIAPDEDEIEELTEIEDPATDDFEEEPVETELESGQDGDSDIQEVFYEETSSPEEQDVEEEELPAEDVSEEEHIADEESAGEEELSEDSAGEKADETYIEPDRQEMLQEYFSEFLGMDGMAGQIEEALDKIRMVAVTGNVIITGNEPSARVKLALALAKAVQQTDIHFLGRVAKISGDLLNTKDIPKSIEALKEGALIIEKAGNLNISTLDAVAKCINHKEARLLFIIEDHKQEIKKLEKTRPYFEKMFTIHIHIPTFSNDDLVNHAKEYAREREYTIDEMGVLALYTRIDEMQTADHYVTVQEVEEIMDEAISHVDKKNLNHLMDVLFAKRYDDDDLIILREKDFIRN